MAGNDTGDAGALPDGWAIATISEMIAADGLFNDGDWVETKDQDPDGDVRLIQLADIGDGVFRNKSERFLTSDKAAELGCTFLKRGDLLIARMPKPLGRACIFPGDPKRCVTAVDVCIVRTGSRSIEHRWLMFATNSPQIRAEIASYQSGSTRKRISRRNLAKIQFRVPPRPEQRRIVAEIETQFTWLEAGVAALKRAQAKLRRYKASVLKAACEGHLLPDDEVRAIRASPDYEPADALLERLLAERRARWQAEHPGKRYKEPVLPDTSDLPGLPEGWVWISLELVASVRKHAISSGPFGSALGKKDYQEVGVPVIRGKNVKNGTLILKDLVFVTNEKAAQLERSIARPGDLIVIAVGSSGQPAIVPSYLPRAVLSQNCNKITLDNDVALPQYVVIAMQIGSTQEQLLKKTTDTARPFLSLTNLRKTLIPLPPVAEQHRIVAEVERRLTTVAELEKQVEVALRRAGRLRQAVLKRAFEGRLVPQDPADEPASALLARIQ